jgi:hypothetical protein
MTKPGLLAYKGDSESRSTKHYHHNIIQHQSTLNTLALLHSALYPPPKTNLQPSTTFNMQFKNCIVLGFAASVFADCDPNSGDNQTDCSSSGGATRTVTSTSTDAAGVVITNLQTTTDIGVSTSLVPVYTPVVDTTTDVGVETNLNTISRTTDIGTTPTNTIVQFATTTDIGLQSGYAYTTNSAGSSVATYTGTDDSQPRTQSITTTATTGAGAAAASGGSSSSSSAESDSFAMATAIPVIGAAAMAGFAFVL